MSARATRGSRSTKPASAGTLNTIATAVPAPYTEFVFVRVCVCVCVCVCVSV